jgi:hypothetical protein
MEEVDVWDSSVKDISGEWFVRYDHHVLGENYLGAGFTPLMTFNTADDNGTEIWITDEGKYWNYKVKITVDPKTLTFGSDEEVINTASDSKGNLYDIKLKIRNGKIIKDAVTQPSGYVSDSIYFEVWFEDLEDETEIVNDTLFVGGFRKSGFLEDMH